MKWIRFILGLCDHQYEVILKNYIYETDKSQRPWGVKYTQRCKKCGKIKAIKV